MSPLISVIIPTFKRLDKLKEAIKSIQSQSFKNWETIIIDNHSDDGTEEFIESLKDKRFKFYLIRNDGVISKSRNLGIQKSNGKYLAFLDSDDWWSPDKLNYINEAITQGYKFIYHDHYIVKPKSILKKRKFFSRSLNKENPYEDLKLNGPCFATSSVVLEKNSLLSIDNFNEKKDFISWEDFDAWLRFLFKNQSIIHIKKFLSFIKIDIENNLTALKKIENIMSFKKFYIDSTHETLPNWCHIELFKNFYFLGKFGESIDYYSKINKKILKLKMRLKLEIIYLLIKLKFIYKD